MIAAKQGDATVYNLCPPVQHADFLKDVQTEHAVVKEVATTIAQAKPTGRVVLTPFEPLFQVRHRSYAVRMHVAVETLQWSLPGVWQATVACGNSCHARATSAMSKRKHADQDTCTAPVHAAAPLQATREQSAK